MYANCANSSTKFNQFSTFVLNIKGFFFQFFPKKIFFQFWKFLIKKLSNFSDKFDRKLKILKDSLIKWPNFKKFFSKKIIFLIFQFLKNLPFLFYSKQNSIFLNFYFSIFFEKFWKILCFVKNIKRIEFF